MFEDATEIELSKSTDVFCCICLGTMSTGSVKKVGCGHFYHTHCLREVVERARSIEAAKCPLCRASVLNGEPPEAPPSEEEANNNNGNNNTNTVVGEDALFRFSTEGILPAWMPLPAFSFEVVRRPAVDANSNNNATQTDRADENDNSLGENPAEESEQQRQQPRAPPQQQQQQRQPSFFRRLLILAGVVPMSAEEERAALEQLVDMFPQYDRADLLRELRSRGSSEGVVESVLMGVFQGVTRGASNTNIVTPASNGQGELERPERVNNQEGERSMEETTIVEVN